MGCTLQGQAQPGTALVTFSSLSGAGFKVGNDRIPQSYQPLLNPSLDPEHLDGANIGVTVFWGGEARGATCRIYPGLTDHTGDADITGDNPGGGAIFQNHPFSISFEHPVEIPSFFWSFCPGPAKGATLTATISVYKNVADSAPIKSVSVVYSVPKGYAWEQAGFPGIPITKIVFEPQEKSCLNVDDITARRADGGSPAK